MSKDFDRRVSRYDRVGDSEEVNMRQPKFMEGRAL